MTSFFIDTPEEFSFEECLYFLNRSPHELLHAAYDHHVEKLINADGERILLSVSVTSNRRLRVSVLNKNILPKAKRFIQNYLEEWFDLKSDLKPFYRMAAKDELLKPVVKKYFGYRVVSMPDLFESLCWAIIGQQINLNFAYMLKQRFVQQYGEKFIFAKKTYYLFPAAELVSKLESHQLLQLQFSKQKAEYVIGLANAFVSGIISKEKLSLLPFTEAKNELIKLKGIGNWTANYALMKTFHHPNAFPIEDAALHQAIRKKLMLDKKPSLKRIGQLFKKYKGWEAYATLYFWRSLGDE